MGEMIKAYKGFNRDMTCGPKGVKFQYEEGKEYETQEAVACKRGFHACERPLDVFKYYAPGASVYHEVEQSGEISRDSEDSKAASTRIRIGARLDIMGLVKAQIEYTKEHTTAEYTDPERATAGNRGAATAGDCGAATAGDWGAATAGNRGAATAGNRGAATAGDWGAATAGDWGAATAGDWGAATSRGRSTAGKNGLAVARGNNVMVKGGLGAILVIAEEKKEDYDVADWKAVIVDGENVKADTWYLLKDGELCEA